MSWENNSVHLPIVAHFVYTFQLVVYTFQLVDATEASFKSWLGRQSEGTESNDRIIVRNSGLCQEISEKERANFLFTLKVFPLDWGSSRDVQDAVNTSRYSVCSVYVYGTS